MKVFTAFDGTGEASRTGLKPIPREWSSRRDRDRMELRQPFFRDGDAVASTARAGPVAILRRERR